MSPGWRTQQRTRRRPALVRDGSNGGRELTRRHKPDYWLLIICAALLGLGLIVIYSISPGLAAVKGVGDNYYVTKQLLAILLGIATFMIAATVPLSFWRQAWKPLALLSAIACLLVFFMPADEAYRANRWLVFGGFSFQVAELVKFALLIGVAFFMVHRWQQGRLNDSNATIKPLFGLFAVLGVVVAKLQSDLGSAAVMAAIVLAMAFVIGVPLRILAVIGAVVVIGAMVAISTSDYRRDRFSTYLNPEADCQSAGYQACQALIAVGSGGIFGLGLGHSVQAYGYLPEASNDSIFAIIAEKFGFVGVALTLGLYMLLIARMKKVIERTSDLYSRLLVAGVLAWVSSQAIINIGAMLGLLPLKGITLPFVSYGGTSLIFLTAALGLVFQISRYTSYSVVQATSNRNEQKNFDYRRNGRGFGRAYNPDIVSRPRT